jgi:hypothetical protein
MSDPFAPATSTSSADSHARRDGPAPASWHGDMTMTTKRSLLVLAPVYRSFDPSALRSLVMLQAACHERGLPFGFEIRAFDPEIHRARAVLLAKFLESDATHALFVDDDIAYNPSAVFRMLDADRDVIAVATPFKYQEWGVLEEAVKLGMSVNQRVATGYNVVGPDPLVDRIDWDAEGIAEVSWVGAALMMVSRSCAQRVVDAHPELRTVTPPVGQACTSVFRPLRHEGIGEELAEDFSFCERVRRQGMKVHAIVNEVVMHTAPLTHVGCFEERLRFCSELNDRRQRATQPEPPNDAPDP